jgi:hypothetical protein
MEKQTLDKIAGTVGIVGGVLGIVAALTNSNPIFSWIAAGSVIGVLIWYFAKGLRTTLIIALLVVMGVATIGVTLWMGPVTVEVTVYIDQNGNGMREGGEPAVGPGMPVRLLDNTGITRDAFTNEQGIATFRDVPQGPYGLQLGAPGYSGEARRLNTNYVVPVSPTAVPATPTVASSPVPTAMPSTTPTEVVLPTSTPQCSDDLVNCSTELVPIFVQDQSHLNQVIVSGNLVIDFRNDQNGSGVAFKFGPPLNVRGFGYLEITGTSTETCTFLIEYKVRSGDQLTIVKTSDFKKFDGTAATTQSFRIPIAYNGEIDEMVINFYDIGEASTVVIESMRLSP